MSIESALENLKEDINNAVKVPVIREVAEPALDRLGVLINIYGLPLVIVCDGYEIEHDWKPGNIRERIVYVIGCVQAVENSSTHINDLYEKVRSAIRNDITRDGNAQNTIIIGSPDGFSLLADHPYYKFKMLVKLIFYSSI